MSRNAEGETLRQVRGLYTAGTALGSTDARLVQRFVEGEGLDREDAFAVLVHRHGPMVLAVCRRMLANPADADDAFQAVFLVLAHRFRTIRDRDSIGGWLYGVAARVSARARREAARRRKKVRVNVRLAVVAPESAGALELGTLDLRGTGEQP